MCGAGIKWSVSHTTHLGESNSCFCLFNKKTSQIFIWWSSNLLLPIWRVPWMPSHSQLVTQPHCSISLTVMSSLVYAVFSFTVEEQSLKTCHHVRCYTQNRLMMKTIDKSVKSIKFKGIKQMSEHLTEAHTTFQLAAVSVWLGPVSSLLMNTDGSRIRPNWDRDEGGSGGSAERFNYYILHFNPLHLLFVLIKHKNLCHQT